MIIDERNKRDGSNQLNSRWAYTALDSKYAEYAVPDEIMIDKKSGQIMYKRKDGKVVSYNPNDGIVSTDIISLLELSTAITSTLSDGQNSILYPTNKESVLASMVYQLENRCDSIDITEGIDNLENTIFTISPEVNGFFLKVNSRSVDKNYIELLTQLYNNTMEIDTRTNCIVFYTVRYIDSKGDDVYKDYREDIELNKMTFLPVLNYTKNASNEIFEGLSTVVRTTVTITSIKAEKLLEVYTPDHISTAPFNKVIHKDGKVMIESYNISTFFNSANDIPEYSDYILNSVVPSQKAIHDTENGSGMTKEERADFAAMKEQLRTMPRTYYTTTQPTELKQNDTWFKLINRLDDHLNIISTNVTFNKEEVEKYLIGQSELVANWSMDERDSEAIFIKNIDD